MMRTFYVAEMFGKNVGIATLESGDSSSVFSLRLYCKYSNPYSYLDWVGRGQFDVYSVGDVALLVSDRPDAAEQILEVFRRGLPDQGWRMREAQ